LRTLQTGRSGFAAQTLRSGRPLRTLRTGWPGFAGGTLEPLRSRRTGHGRALRRRDVTPDAGMASRHDMPSRSHVLSPCADLSETVGEVPGRRPPVIVAVPGK
jgi:hypothetical protein